MMATPGADVLLYKEFHYTSDHLRWKAWSEDISSDDLLELHVQFFESRGIEFTADDGGYLSYREHGNKMFVSSQVSP